MAFPKDFELTKPEGSGNSKYTMSHLKEPGEVKIRVMSEFITGKCVWGDIDGKRTCTRAKEGDSIPTKAIGNNKFSGEPERIKDFAAAIVWNYEVEQLEVFETDKATIIEQIMDFEEDEDYGDSRSYDIKIKRAGEKKDTTYSVMPLPPKDAPKKALEAYEDHGIELDALYEGDDPFENAKLPF